MKKIIGWIKGHQVVSFFTITFGISWGLGFTYYAINNPGQEFLYPFASVATCGPALAGIIITKICNTEPKLETKRSFWIAFPVALIVSTLVFLTHNVIINNATLSPLLVVFLAVMAIPVALILSASTSRVPTVRRYLGSVYKVRQVWGWLILAPLVLLGLDVLSIMVGNLLGRQSVTLSDLPFTGLTLLKMVVITLLYQIFFFNLTGEEIGWRGFALPRLLARTNPLVASLILTVFWSLWHAFYWGASGDPVLSLQFWLDNLVRLFPATMVINWFYIRSKGSILVAGVTHAIANTFFQYMPDIDWSVHTAVMYGFALVLFVSERMWVKLPSDHPALSQVSEKETHTAENFMDALNVA